MLSTNPGDHVTAWTYRYSNRTDAQLSVRGKVISDSGGRELIICPDKGTNFDDEMEFVVYKDQLT